MRMHQRILRTAMGSVFAAMLLAAAPAGATVHLTLKRAFVEKYKNRATIDAKFTVDKAHPHPNTPAKDGDLHIAGRAPEILLPTVAEIMNAANFRSAVDDVHAAEGSGQAVEVTGAWRIWVEHGGDSTQTQGAPLKPFNTTNPDHVFEIHPLTKFGDVDLRKSFRSVEGFTYKDAEGAFQRYENVRSHLKCGATISLDASMVGYNYVDFTIQLLEDPTHDLDDGGISVFSSVFEPGGDLLVQKRRMIFVAGTAPYTKIRTLKAGDTLHVLGIPRLDLSLVSWRCANKARNPEMLDWNLPYEMIIVAVLP